MQRHAWPGNVRELMNRIRRATAICETRLIEASDLGLERRDGADWLLTLASARAEAATDQSGPATHLRECVRGGAPAWRFPRNAVFADREIRNRSEERNKPEWFRRVVK